MKKSYQNIIISQSDIDNFAGFSHDFNPLHVNKTIAKQTFFKSTISHGVLAVLKALLQTLKKSGQKISTLDVEFRKPIFPGIPYQLGYSVKETGLKINVKDDTADALIINLETQRPDKNLKLIDLSWFGTLTDTAMQFEKTVEKKPCDRNIERFKENDIIQGGYNPDFEILQSEFKTGLPESYLSVLALCSYLVGMKIPGLRSLFTRMTLTFSDQIKTGDNIAYQLQTESIDKKFRIIQNSLTVCSSKGEIIAAGTLKSYIRFCPVETNFSKIQKMMSSSRTALSGKTALVCGGSRGLGSEIAISLAFAGCKVFATYLNSDLSVKALKQQVQSCGLDLEFIHGDVGEMSWCDQTLERLQTECGGLDILVLSAAIPPGVFEFGKNDVSEFDHYLTANLKLVQRPLNAFLGPINEKKGVIAAISSSFVVEAPKEFPHYVALKQAVEGLVQSVSKEYLETSFLLPRPPKLQTSWNDTPTGVLGTLPTDQVAVNIVNAMIREQKERVSILTEFPVIPIAADVEEKTEADFHAVISANFTADPITPGLEFWFKELKISGDVQLSPYNQILQELINPGSLLSSNKNGISTVLLKVNDWLREFDEAKVQSGESVKKYLLDTAAELIRAMKTHRQHCKVETVLVLCPTDWSDLKPDWSDLTAATEEFLIESLEGLPGLTLLKADTFHPQYHIEKDQVFDSLREKIGHIPYRKSYYHFLATLLIRNVYRKMIPVCKVVVVDCDNTLWKGVVGEVGAKGLVFEPSHVALQEKLMALSQGGVVISLCSKNEAFDVWSVFESREDFKLKRESIVSAMINWQPKSENIKKLANQLNLGLANFIFIDDNPVECAEVTASCPEVLTIQWPLESEKACRLLDHIWELDVKKGTEVDQKRTRMYKEELKRQEFMEEKVDFGDFLKSLELKMDLRNLDDADLPRASQLTMRTNQFNFTTKRRKEGELKAMMSDDDFIMQTVRVKDRFGDYGLVGFYIAEKKVKELVVDTFLLSCRVLGRGVEHYMLNELGRFAGKNRLEKVRLDIYPTPRNTPARDFLKKVTPDGCCECFEDGGIRSVIPSGELAKVEIAHSIEKEDGEPTTEESKAPENKKDEAEKNIPPTDTREMQIERAAFELSDMGSLSAMIDGESSGQIKDKSATDTLPDKAGVTDFVYGVFSNELKLPVESLKQIDILEDIGCDSFKIVEITVLLIEKFSWIPETLLFEHRSISDIIDGILKVQSKGGAAQENSDIVFSGSEGKASEKYHDVAVIGLGLSCAAGNTKEALWELLFNGQSAIKRVDFNRKFFLDSLSETGSHWAGLMDSIDRFDAEFFGISPREALLTDPQTRLILETAWKSLEDAGYAGNNSISDTGVYMGVMYNDYSHIANQFATQDKSIYRSWETFSVANRLSHFMGFRGPSFTVDTACSSSGTAIHLAVRALRAGECRMAVAGGVNLILDPKRFIQLGRLGILSPTGKCRPFCNDSNGVLLGEGAGVVVLKPLVEAHKDKDHIYGVIKGSALSSGTGSIGFTAPNPNAQALAISRCILDSGVDPRTISYIETHGTGTALGDPIEIRGLTLSYARPELWDSEITYQQKCSIGSIKPNIGHLESAAGVLGLIKVLLQFENKHLLPSITSGALNSKIPFTQTPFDVQQSARDWNRPTILVDGEETTCPLRAGLSSFGVGGANTHIILEEPPFEKEGQITSVDISESPSLNIFTSSALNIASLETLLAKVAEFLKKFPEYNPVDISFTANVKRKHFNHRIAFLYTELSQLSDKISKVLAGEIPPGCFLPDREGHKKGGKIAFLFTGQGSQYCNMGQDLYQSQPVFKKAVDQCAEILDQWLEIPLRDIIFAAEGTKESDLINQTQYTQVALFSVEYALFQLWKHWGIKPDFLVGHSAGEIIALTASGILSLKDGLKLISVRGKIMQALPGGGKMAAVRINESGIGKYLTEYEKSVSIASVNAPEQVVISGEGSDIDQITSALETNRVDYKFLNVSHAFHSPLIEPMLEEYIAVVDTINLEKPEVPVVSCVNGEILDLSKMDQNYWKNQVRQAVRFKDAMNLLDSEGVNQFVEIGPHPILLGMGSLCAPEDENIWLPSMRKNFNGLQGMYESLSTLYILGTKIDWEAFYGDIAAEKADLPTYAFQHKKYWLQPSEYPVTIPSDRNIENKLIYHVEWVEKSFEQIGLKKDSAQTWMLFMDQGQDYHHVESRMKELGHNCISIRMSDEYCRHSEQSYEINPHSPKDYKKVFDQCIKTFDEIEGLAFFPLSENRNNSALEVETLQKYSLLEISCLLSLVQTINTLESSKKPKIWLITNQVNPAKGVPENNNSLIQSLAWGFGKGISLEYSDFWGGLIDIDHDFNINDNVDTLINCLMNVPEEDQIRLSKKSLQVPRLSHLSISAEKKPQLSGDKIYLITGGTGALGQKLIRAMIRWGARHFIVTSRQGMQKPDAAEFVQEIQSLGADIEIISVDVGDQPSVSKLFADITKRELPLKGIFHLAGLDQLKSVFDMSLEDAQRIMLPKVIGSWLLHQYSQDLDLDLFVCFSSISAILGSENRAHYSAANAFIDNLVSFRQNCGLPGLSINWGPWKDGGMAGESEIEAYAKLGNYALDPDTCMAVLGDLISGSVSQAIVADIDWRIFSKVYEGRRVRPIITSFRQDEKIDTKEKTGVSAAWVEKLNNIPEQQRLNELTRLIVTELCRLLGYDTEKDFPLEDDFSRIGVDSLIAVQLSASIKRYTKLDRNIDVYDYPNITVLAGKLLSELSIEENKELQLDEEEPRKITGYEAVLEDSILSFFHEAWPNRDQNTLESRWRWMFVESASRLNIEPVMWNYIETGTVIGFTGSIPVIVKIGKDELPTGWLVDTMILKACRNKGLGPRIMIQSQKDMPFSLSLGQTKEMRTILINLGWKQVSPLQTYVYPLRPGKMLKGKMNALFAGTAGAGLQILTYSKKIKNLGKFQDLKAKFVDRFSSRHDALWETVKNDYGCAAIRDASYLNWKYVDQPGQKFYRVELLDEQKVVAVAVLMVREPGRHSPYKYRRAFIVDLVSPLSNEPLLLSVLDVLKKEADTLGADSIIFEVINKSIEGALEQYGFIKREPTRYFLIHPSGLDEKIQKSVLSPERWFVTKGDSDIDRPEGAEK